MNAPHRLRDAAWAGSTTQAWFECRERARTARCCRPSPTISWGPRSRTGSRLDPRAAVHVFQGDLGSHACVPPCRPRPIPCQHRSIVVVPGMFVQPWARRPAPSSPTPLDCLFKPRARQQKVPSWAQLNQSRSNRVAQPRPDRCRPPLASSLPAELIERFRLEMSSRRRELAEPPCASSTRQDRPRCDESSARSSRCHRSWFLTGTISPKCSHFQLSPPLGQPVVDAALHISARRDQRHARWLVQGLEPAHHGQQFEPFAMRIGSASAALVWPIHQPLSGRNSIRPAHSPCSPASTGRNAASECS